LLGEHEAGGTDFLTVLPTTPEALGLVVAPKKVISSDLDKLRITSFGFMGASLLTGLMYMYSRTEEEQKEEEEEEKRNDGQRDSDRKYKITRILYLDQFTHRTYGSRGYAHFMSLLTSQEILEFSIRIPWALMVSNYVFLVVSGSGLCIVSSLGHVFGMKRYELISKRCVFLAFITILFGMFSIAIHLGHPERALVYN
jgi:hypothetical protein